MATEIKHAIRTQSAWDSMDPGEQAQYDGHYTSLGLWATGQARNLVAVDEIAVAEVFPDWPGSGPSVVYPTFEITTSWTMDATRFAVIRAPVGMAWDISSRSGARVGADAGDSHPFVIRSGTGNNLYVQDVAIQLGGGYDPISRPFIFDGGVVYFSRVHIFDTNVLNSGTAPGPSSGYIDNSLIEIDYSDPSRGPALSYYVEIKNCTVIATLGNGAFNGDILVDTCQDVSNTVCYNENTKSTYNSFWDSSSSAGSNAQNSNGSANPPGSNPYLTVVTGDFLNYAGGDFHLSASSNIKGLGANLYPTYTLDIDSQSWPDAGPWDIGADYEAGGGEEPAAKPNPLMWQDF